MGLPGTVQLMSLLLVVTAGAALCGFLAAPVAQRKKRSTRRVFVVGVFCGLLAGQIVRGRRRTRTLMLMATRRQHRRRRDHRAQRHGGFRARAFNSAARLLT